MLSANNVRSHRYGAPLLRNHLHGGQVIPYIIVKGAINTATFSMHMYAKGDKNIL
jgi:hypothetical protein